MTAACEETGLGVCAAAAAGQRRVVQAVDRAPPPPSGARVRQHEQDALADGPARLRAGTQEAGPGLLAAGVRAEAAARGVRASHLFQARAERRVVGEPRAGVEAGMVASSTRGHERRAQGPVIPLGKEGRWRSRGWIGVGKTFVPTRANLQGWLSHQSAHCAAALRSNTTAASVVQCSVALASPPARLQLVSSFASSLRAALGALRDLRYRLVAGR